MGLPMISSTSKNKAEAVDQSRADAREGDRAGALELAQRAAAARCVDDLDFSAATRRVLTRLGCVTFLDVTEQDEKKLMGALRSSEGDRLLDLIDLYHGDPESFVRRFGAPRARVSQSHPMPAAWTSASGEPTGTRTGAHRVPSRGPSVASTYRSRSATYQVLPRDELGTRLYDFERRAVSALRLLEDHSREALVMEAFPSLGVGLEQAERDVKTLISDYGYGQAVALDVLSQCAPDALLVVCAHLTQEVYTGRSLWPELFGKIGLTNPNLQGVLKGLLLERIQEHGFPVYTSDDESQYYINTMLLHSGLSASVWKPLWRDLLIPVARATRANGLVEGVIPNGEGLLHLSRDDESRFRVSGTRLQKMLRHVPARMIAPVLETAFGTARQVVEYDGSGLVSPGRRDKTMVLSGGELPETAIGGLAEALAEHTAPDDRRSRPSRGGGASVVYLPEPELRLDLSNVEKPLCLHWNGVRLPRTLAGDRVDYYINHELAGSSRVVDNVSSALIESIELRVSTSSYFDIEVKLVEEAEGPASEGAPDVREREVAARSSSFRHTRPSVFEFLRGSDGVWRLRKRLTSLERRSRIAYLMAPGFALSPQGGMELVNRERIGDLALEIYDVSPGGSADLLDGHSEKVSSWSESFVVEFEKPFRIGRNERGSDVFPYLTRDGFGNTALPTVAVRSMGVGVNARDLEVRCLCDGRRVSISRSYPFAGDGDGAPSSVMLQLSKSSIPLFVADGLLVVKQRSTDRALLRYRFSVVPVRSFGLLTLGTMLGRVSATYRLETVVPVELERGGRPVYNSGGNAFDFSAPLSDASTDLSLRLLAERGDSDEPETCPRPELVAEGPALRVRLFLAAVVVDLGATGTAASERPLSLADVVRRDCCDGRVEIVYEKTRPHRGAFALFGQRPVHYYAEDHPAQFRLDLFDQADAFIPSTAPEHDEQTALELTVTYGFDWRAGKVQRMTARIVPLVALRGFGLGGIRLESDGDDVLVRFERPAGRELACRLVNRRGEDLLDGQLTLGERQSEMRLPTKIGALLRRGHQVWLLLAVRRRLWGPDFERAQRVDLRALYDRQTGEGSHA